MFRKVLVSYIFIIVYSVSISGQVKVRLFSSENPGSAFFSVTDGTYKLNFYNGEIILLSKGDLVIISRFNGKLAVKSRDTEGYICDSIQFNGDSEASSFSLLINTLGASRRYYSGNLKCLPDLGTLLMINTCNVESYIAGVVRAEGGKGKDIEYCKTQAVLARTYMYKYFDKHIADSYNLCDNTHCQAFNGLSSDTLVNTAVLNTAGQVILSKDSSLIIAAFHSNCGGETANSQDVWLTSQPYLKKVIDPYCTGSRNASWEKSVTLSDWIDLINDTEVTHDIRDQESLNFRQNSRLTDYKTGSITIPLTKIRERLALRSTFFSVEAAGDSIKLKGRGYGHGVGLCQEGAMEMGQKGFKYNQIINFYYSGVIISDIKNALTKNE